MAKIIPLHTGSHPTATYTLPAWILTSTIFWQHCQLHRQEVAYSKNAIQQYLVNSNNYKQGFISYCERVLLSGKISQAEPASWIDLPTIWFHPAFNEGFIETKNLHQRVVDKRKEITNYQEGISVFATSYFTYISTKDSTILGKCYNRLLNLKEYWLLQLWCNTIMLFQIANK